MGLLAKASVAIDGSKFKAVNNRDKNFTRGEGRAAPGAAGGERRALSEPARHRRPAGAIGDARAQDDAAEGEARKAARGDGEARGHREADAGLARPADLAHRSRQPLDGDERARLRRRRLQCAGRGRHRAPSDRRARGHECRPDRSQLANVAKQTKAALQVGEARGRRGPRLLQWRRDPGMRAGRYHGDAAEADDLGREGGGPLRQAGLRLSARRGCLSLSGR